MKNKKVSAKQEEMGKRKINNMGMYYLMVYSLFIKHNNNIQQFHATYNNTGYQIDIKMHRDLCWCNHQVFIYTGCEIKACHCLVQHYFIVQQCMTQIF